MNHAPCMMRVMCDVFDVQDVRVVCNMCDVYVLCVVCMLST